jgi:hypothetical protein
VEKLATAVRRLDHTELAELARGVQLLESIIGSMRGAGFTTKNTRLERRHQGTK